MLRSKTVLVLGAGASCELGFPSGPALLKSIAEELDIRFDHFTQIAGSTVLMEAIRRHHRDHNPTSDINDYLRAAWRLRDAARIARSIDNAIDQNDTDPLVATVGKLAIAHQIGVEEAKSRLKRLDNEPRIFDLNVLGGTWLVPFAQMLTTDLRASQAEEIFNNLEVISFNYDRSFEAFLPTIFFSAYGFRPEDAQRLSASLKVFHPYGSLGLLPWQATDPLSADYGAASKGSVEKIATSLRTFTERNHDLDQLADMRQSISEAEILIFIGFGFHRQNMVLLTPDEGTPMNSPRIYATVYQELPGAIPEIRQSLANIYNVGPSKMSQVPMDLMNGTSFELLSSYYSPLTA